MAVPGAERQRRGRSAAGQPDGGAGLECAWRPQLQLAPAPLGPTPAQEATCTHILPLPLSCIFFSALHDFHTLHPAFSRGPLQAIFDHI